MNFPIIGTNEQVACSIDAEEGSLQLSTLRA